MWYPPASDGICPLRRMTVDESRCAKPFRRSHFPLVVLVAQLRCREPTQDNEYLRTANRILRSKLPRRIPFTDKQRRALVDAALVMSRKLMRQVVSIVQIGSSSTSTDPIKALAIAFPTLCVALGKR